jgi:hypothetical protein
MQTEKLPNGRAASAPDVVASANSDVTQPRRRGTVAKAAANLASASKLAKVTVNGSASTSKSKAPSSRRVKFSFSVPLVEHEAIVALKHKLSEAVGSKVKKSDIVRAGVLLLLSLPDAKIRTALGKIPASDGSHSENGKLKK